MRQNSSFSISVAISGACRRALRRRSSTRRGRRQRTALRRSPLRDCRTRPAAARSRARADRPASAASHAIVCSGWRSAIVANATAHVASQPSCRPLEVEQRIDRPAIGPQRQRRRATATRRAATRPARLGAQPRPRATRCAPRTCRPAGTVPPASDGAASGGAFGQRRQRRHRARDRRCGPVPAPHRPGAGRRAARSAMIASTA